MTCLVLLLTANAAAAAAASSLMSLRHSENAAVDSGTAASWDDEAAFSHASASRHTAVVLRTVSVIMVLLWAAVVYNTYREMMNTMSLNLPPQRGPATSALAVRQQDDMLTTDETSDSVDIRYSDDGDLETGVAATKECRKRQTQQQQQQQQQTQDLLMGTVGS
jgi:hypothetical protein